jgi:two-component SAPR family response regulator
MAARITRRLAPQVLLRDLGPVTIAIGDHEPQRTLRRKVLGLLCFMASRPGMACTRDEALDAIWPDLGPDTAANSLHQTIYYLRRVFEPTYKEGMSAGYLEFDGDVLTLDKALVDAESRRCWRLVERVRRGDNDAVEELVAIYRGTYALDFAYEDWATDYRENLHAAVLGVVEAEARNATRRGDPERAIALTQRVLAIDPAADAIELELLRAYKVGGWHSAAAEQYAHYAAYVRGELGAEPLSYSEV